MCENEKVVELLIRFSFVRDVVSSENTQEKQD